MWISQSMTSNHIPFKCSMFNHFNILIGISLFLILFISVHKPILYRPTWIPFTNSLLLFSTFFFFLLLINMSNNYLCLLGALDSLWFHQTIFFPEPISLLGPKSTETPQDSTANSSFTYPSSSIVSLQAVASQEASSNFLDSEIASPCTPDSPETSTPQDYETKRPTRLDMVANRLMLIRSQSSSPVQRNNNNNNNNNTSPRKSRTASGLLSRKLEKSMSMRSLGELELEELKGLMDLGFTFKKENLNPRMMSLVPGLQRLRVCSKNRQRSQNSSDDDENVQVDKAKDENNDEEVGVGRRPYLSEAWLIKRPDSPLLNFRLPNRVSSAADMKKHLQSWARTVASEIQQES